MNERLGQAVAGFSEGGRYERARPGYPSEAITALLDRCRIDATARVLDLAAGTGKLTRHIVAAGADVVAVDPTAGMRAALAEGLPGVVVRDGTAEAIPFPAASFDVVTVGQAFHWFDGPAAVAEIRRVLAPNGRLGLLWNVMDRDVPWVDELQRRVHRHRGSSPWYSGHEWRSAFAESREFAPLQHRSFRNTQIVDLDGLLERIASVSFVATLDPSARGDLMADLTELITRRRLSPARITVPYRTDLFWTVVSNGDGGQSAV